MVLLVAVLGCILLGAILFGYSYHSYQRVVDERLSNGPLFASTAQIYAAPREVRPGQALSAQDIAQELHSAGYNINPQLGTYQLSGSVITIKPGSGSYHNTDGATITTTGGTVQSIAAENGASLRAYELEPLLITGLSEDKNRIKRRLVTYNQIPRRMVDAVTSIEDRKFFEHGGINMTTMVGWVYHDLVGDRRVRGGGSTLTMQLAKLLFVPPNRSSALESAKYKFRQIVVAFQLESRFNKQQIFEIYSNEINLGQRGSFAINGFGEAAQAYFGKDLRQIDVAQCALLAGMIQRPNYFNPYRHPERALERRNIVLRSMVETGTLTPADAERAQAEPIRLAQQNVDASEAPYFVDLVHDQLQQRLGDQSSGSSTLRIYTSLDPDLQKAAAEAVTVGMQKVDEIVRAKHKTETNFALPQVALVALNPHTGQVLALVGGRNYGASQYNHATAKRPTSSIFKPFVYAAAEAGAVNGQQLTQSVDAEGNVSGSGTFTAATLLSDVPTTFTYDNGRQTYSPRNYEGHFHGQVTAAEALALSLNNATVSLGEKVGFENVAAFARSAGITGAKGTPAVALGSYDATPLDMAGAYTTFANGGVHLNPWMLASVRNDKGDVVADFTPQASQVMDPKAAYLTQNLLQGVMDFGYGTAVRKAGFTAPAAGKTGTGHDAWFAAYSSNLICVVWVGNDDYTDVKLSGAIAAAPIWAEFMKRAIKLPQYSDMKPFAAPPAGISYYTIDRNSGQLADSTCPEKTVSMAFLDGSQPHNTCSRMGDSGLMGTLFGDSSDTAGTSMTGGGYSTGTPQSNGNPSPPQEPPAAGSRPSVPANNNPESQQQQQQHRNVFQKMFGLGKHKDDGSTPPEAIPPPNNPH